MVPYKLTRSARKTVAIHVRNGIVDVRAPFKTPLSNIDRFVASKEKWIEGKLSMLSERAAQRENFSLTYGDQVTYRGRLYPIAEKPGRFPGFDGERFYMPPGLSPEQIKAACIKIYRTLAERDLNDRAVDFVGQMLVLPTAVKINNAKARWGSCSSKKIINFSWRLIMADDDLIDYVVVHELAHIAELNHSARFWAIVESVLPDYAKRRARLRELQKRLACEDWD